MQENKTIEELEKEMSLKKMRLNMCIQFLQSEEKKFEKLKKDKQALMDDVKNMVKEIILLKSNCAIGDILICDSIEYKLVDVNSLNQLPVVFPKLKSGKWSKKTMVLRDFDWVTKTIIKNKLVL